jgi:hypothetical protein
VIAFNYLKAVGEISWRTSGLVSPEAKMREPKMKGIFIHPWLHLCTNRRVTDGIKESVGKSMDDEGMPLTSTTFAAKTAQQFLRLQNRSVADESRLFFRACEHVGGNSHKKLNLAVVIEFNLQTALLGLQHNHVRAKIF